MTGLGSDLQGVCRLSSIMLPQFTLPPTVDEGTSLFTSLSAFVVFWFSDDSPFLQNSVRGLRASVNSRV